MTRGVAEGAVGFLALVLIFLAFAVVVLVLTPEVPMAR